MDLEKLKGDNNGSRDVDIEELYLTKCDLKEVPDMARFKNLRRLYLNKNKMFHIGNGLRYCYILTELYLQNNMLTEINGCLQHMTCLRILMLHANQLTVITDVMHEMRHMMDLKVLNLFLNPLSQEFNYRDYVIQCIPSLELFDRKAVTLAERDKVAKKYNVERQKIKETIAFGRRVDKPPQTPTYNPPSDHLLDKEFADYLTLEDQTPPQDNKDEENIESLIANRNISKEVKYADAVESRAKKRSVMQFKTFSWVNILNDRDKDETKNETEAVIFTAKFR